MVGSEGRSCQTGNGHNALRIPSRTEGQVVVNQTGNPGMATAGSGDVLGGIITGMIAQFNKKFPIIKILQAAVFIHGYAGDIASLQKGESPMIASDIVDNISRAVGELNEYKSEFRFT